MTSSLMPAGPDAQHMMGPSSMSVVIVTVQRCRRCVQRDVTTNRFEVLQKATKMSADIWNLRKERRHSRTNQPRHSCGLVDQQSVLVEQLHDRGAQICESAESNGKVAEGGQSSSDALQEHGIPLLHEAVEVTRNHMKDLVDERENCLIHWNRLRNTGTTAPRVGSDVVNRKQA